MTFAETIPLAVGCWLEHRAHPNCPGFTTLQIAWSMPDADTPKLLNIDIVEPRQAWSRYHTYDGQNLPRYDQTVGAGKVRVTLQSGARQTFYTFGGILHWDATTHTSTLVSDAPILHESDDDTNVVELLAEEAATALARLHVKWGMRSRKMMACLANHYTPQFLYWATLQSVLQRPSHQVGAMRADWQLHKLAEAERQYYLAQGKWNDQHIPPLDELQNRCD